MFLEATPAARSCSRLCNTLILPSRGLSVSRLNGALEGTPSHGGVELGDIGGPVVVHSSNGGIKAESVGGALEATTSNAGIRARLASVEGTSGDAIEGNQITYNRGPWGTTPYPQQVMGIGDGIYLKDSDKVTVIENRVSSNSGLDINWDGKGQITFSGNACNTSNGAGVCGR